MNTTLLGEREIATEKGVVAGGIRAETWCLVANVWG